MVCGKLHIFQMLLIVSIFFTFSFHQNKSFADEPILECPSDFDIVCTYKPANPNNYTTLSAQTNGRIVSRSENSELKYKYIIIHITEETFDDTVSKTQDPNYGASFNYLSDNSTNRIYQFLNPDTDVAWHSANSFYNTQAIGIEQVGIDGNPDSITNRLYKNTASLVKYLCEKYNIPLDRQHILGHDEIPTTSSDKQRIIDQHYDPGPYYNWNYLFELMGSRIGPNVDNSNDVEVGDVVTIRPDFHLNKNKLTNSCQNFYTKDPDCTVRKDYSDVATNFLYVYKNAFNTSVFADDAIYSNSPNDQYRGSHLSSDLISSANHVSCGMKIFIHEIKKDENGIWIGFYWGGGNALFSNDVYKNLVWIYSDNNNPAIVLTPSKTVTVKNDSAEFLVNPFSDTTNQCYTIYKNQIFAVFEENIQSYLGGSFVSVQVAHRVLFINADQVDISQKLTPAKHSVKNVFTKFISSGYLSENLVFTITVCAMVFCVAMIVVLLLLLKKQNKRI